MHFVHNEASISHKTIQEIGVKHIYATEVNLILNDFIFQFKTRFKEMFHPLVLKGKLSDFDRT